MASILVIDDEQHIRSTLEDILSYEGYEVSLATNGLEGLEEITKHDFSVVMCDIKMEKMDGVEVLEKVMEIKPEIPFVIISGHGDIDVAVECLKKGAYDFLRKPLDINRVLASVRNALEKKDLVAQTKALKKKVSQKYAIVGESKALQYVLDITDKVSETDARVLITGENGVGKELIARRIHEMSGRSASPFIEVNCAAIPAELIESELFGHEKGAFTSDHKRSIGKFEQADGGTLFLDEIGDMSLSAQAKVLRALQENVISRVGSDKNIKVQVRVIAATNKDLVFEIEQGRFREDLYHRLSVIVLKVPALRERVEDIPLLVNHFLKDVSKKYGKPSKEMTKEAIKALQEMSWTGNVRELYNVVERLVILGEDPISLKNVESFVVPH